MSLDGAKSIQVSEASLGLKSLMEKAQYEHFEKHGSVDFAFSYSDEYRLRANVYRQMGGLSLSLRVISNHILNIEELNLPPIFKDMAENYKQGFFLVVGPTGEGKSTSLAAVINHINKNRKEHIITIEDPIEYIIQNDKRIIDQREVGIHTSSFSHALKTCMRQDPDIIVIGEMRDYETMQAAITLAETGHLVFSTMHTNDSVQTIDRIIDSFPNERQKQIRSQMAASLTGIISQRLIPTDKGGLVMAYEQLIFTDAVRNIVRSEKLEQIYNILQSGGSGMIRLEQRLAQMVDDETISVEKAMAYANKPEIVDMLLD
jgi:twitching motility protein PilT